MGGISSGRRSRSGKRTTDGMLRLDIRRLQRGGMLQAGSVTSLQWRQGDHEQVVGSNRLRLNLFRKTAYRTPDVCV